MIDYLTAIQGDVGHIRYLQLLPFRTAQRSGCSAKLTETKLGERELYQCKMHQDVIAA